MTDAPIRISAQVSSDPGVCAFTLDRPVYDGSYNCASPAMAEGSPLLEALFALPGVRQVWVAGDRVTVEKTGDEPWPEFGRRIGGVLREQIRSGRTLLSPETQRPRLEELVRRRAQAALDARVNPSLASHGGRADVAGVEGGVVYVRLSGGCQGCGSAQATFRQGVEKAILAEVPEAAAVRDVTDHAAGTNPYYKEAGGASPVAGG